MTSCVRTIVTPGTPTSGSGYASRLTRQAVQCDQARLLARLQGGSGAQCPVGPTLNGSAVSSGVLEQRASIPCQSVLSVLPNGSTQSNQTSVTVLQINQQYPKAGVPESVRIQNLIQQTILAAVDPLNPATRFAGYDRTIVPLPCPLPIDSINPAIPAARTIRRVCHLWPGS